MRALSITSEALPVIKTGGLADVAGALPRALSPHGVITTTLIPAYPSVLKQVPKATLFTTLDGILGTTARVLKAHLDGHDWLLLDIPELYGRDGGPYIDVHGRDYADNWRRFAALGLAGARLAQGAEGQAGFDVVHAHDWQAAMVCVYLKHAEGPRPPSLLTIHNLAFQGRFGAEVFGWLGLPPNAFGLDGLEYYGDVSFLKGGLATADAITTVSPTYAMEIRRPDFGMGLDGIIRARGPVVHGILNGIDTEAWDPAADTALKGHYTANRIEPRRLNRTFVRQAFGLKASRGPLICVISRLTWQKGIDLLVDLFPELVAQGAQLAILGSGEPALEAAVQAGAQRYKGQIAVRIGYDEAMSHLMQGGCDMILVPSRFEPCGLTQLYGLRYGCVPVVARIGGLSDSIIDANEAALRSGVATGFQCEALYGPHAHDQLRDVLKRAVSSFCQPRQWRAIQKAGMKSDFSWSRSGKLYAQLYADLLSRR